MGEPTCALRFRSLGHGNYFAELRPLNFIVQPQAQLTGRSGRFEAIVRRGNTVVARQKDFAAAGGAKGWCQHWQMVNGGAVRRVAGGAR
jgi:hypothetical protein